MSILRRKIDLNRGGPAPIEPINEMWDPLHRSMCQYLSSLSVENWEPRNCKVKTGDFKTLSSEIDLPTPFFRLGTRERPMMMAMAFDNAMTRWITQTRLGVENNNNAEAQAPGQLDLMLMRPPSDIVQKAVQALWIHYKSNGQRSELRFTAQGLSPKTFDVPKDGETWVSVALASKLMPPTDETGKPLPEENSQDSALDELSEVKCYIIMPRSLYESISSDFLADRGNNVIDPTSPWARHMRSTVSQATAPVKVILEKKRMSIAECTRFELGQVIELPGVSLDNLSLETEIKNGFTVFAQGQLGVFRSSRAVKLIDDLEDDFITDIHTVGLNRV